MTCAARTHLGVDDVDETSSIVRASKVAVSERARRGPQRPQRMRLRVEYQVLNCPLPFLRSPDHSDTIGGPGADRDRAGRFPCFTTVVPSR